ncbi:MAG: hypothetical protein A2660_02250 [Candidatus Doudnabacteria bacterium RIFCSPHIGHO2_01_FULL_45_18]|uniref:Uncharacterized protein n=1 Tax=Candidatus Doudnabacteria bacterium RIFCSPHIGHO2_01_FULL_45_18 TaxID=1817823 RepID=A0A1F5NRY7_9BACT|nr:MAG: hypothetical protein A2660_02250 [Candidatus Doudnabacteria bacterium RIFCSPHIGHO2_01_FULL_45_18]
MDLGAVGFETFAAPVGKIPDFKGAAAGMLCLELKKPFLPTSLINFLRLVFSVPGSGVIHKIQRGLLRLVKYYIILG